MKRLWLLALLLVAALAGGPESAWAKRYQDGATGGNRAAAGDSVRWEQMSPEQRQELKQRYQQFQQLPPEKKQQLRELNKRLQQLAPQQKQELHRSGSAPSNCRRKSG
ncbi:MAG: DUF3106 domain-containing protein [Syntrophotaleaceae bacterium]